MLIRSTDCYIRVIHFTALLDFIELLCTSDLWIFLKEGGLPNPLGADLQLPLMVSSFSFILALILLHKSFTLPYSLFPITVRSLLNTEVKSSLILCKLSRKSVAFSGAVFCNFKFSFKFVVRRPFVNNSAINIQSSIGSDLTRAAYEI